MDLADVAGHPHTAHRGMLVEVPDSAEYRGTGNPIKLSRTPPAVRTAPPVFGEDTREVLGGLGYTQSEIDELIAAGIVFSAAAESR
jgi:formyl-CoA transferase